MSNLPSAAIVVIHRQLGYITGQQLVELGVTERQRQRLETQGVLERVGRALYWVPGMPRSLESRAVEICLQHPDGFVTGVAAGVLLGMRQMPHTFGIEFCVKHGSRFSGAAHVVLRQSTLIPVEHVRVLDSGVRIASYKRLAFDLAARLSPTALSSVVEQMIQRGNVTLDELFEVSALMWSAHRPGSTAFNRMLLRRHSGAAPESHPELLVLQGLLERNVPVRPQEQLMLASGRRIRIDMAVPEVKWAVEVDIHPSHHGFEGSARDKQRDRELHRVGWQIERVTSIDFDVLGATLDELAELYRARVRLMRV